jgi:hypothetical protein
MRSTSPITFLTDLAGWLSRAAADMLMARMRRRANFRTALEFNREFTYTHTKQAGWMCPTCNRVHRMVGRVPFVGPIYPACCTFAEGSRLERRHATGGRA